MIASKAQMVKITRIAVITESKSLGLSTNKKPQKEKSEKISKNPHAELHYQRLNARFAHSWVMRKNTKILNVRKRIKG